MHHNTIIREITFNTSTNTTSGPLHRQWLLLFYLLCIFSSLFFQCKSRNEAIAFEEYDGPIVEAENVVTYYSDSARVTLKLEAEKQLEFDNGDREFPKGVYLEFYDEDGNISSTMRSDYCYYTQATGIYKASGDVVIKGVKKEEQLNTEELFWNQREEKIHTDKFVRIEKDGEIHMGDGLEANQDFTEYSILKSRGSIYLEEGNP
jgi:LPS export ABC transporter protein LptC